MSFSKQHIVVTGIFLTLFLILYFGCDTKSKEQDAIVTTRAENLEIINLDRIIAEEKKLITGQSLMILEGLEQELASSRNDSTTIESIKTLASFWYQQDQPLISGYYAKKIAEKLGTDLMAWSICGTTFAIASKSLQDDQQIKYAILKSREAFESALSIEPDNIENRINLALSYVDFPLEENPMKGILMLVELNKQNPDNPSVLFQLGRLALGTNQLEKAVERLTAVININPAHREAHCLLSEAYEKLGDTASAAKEKIICNS